MFCKVWKASATEHESVDTITEVAEAIYSQKITLTAILSSAALGLLVYVCGVAVTGLVNSEI